MIDHHLLIAEICLIQGPNQINRLFKGGVILAVAVASSFGNCVSVLELTTHIIEQVPLPKRRGNG